MSVDLYVFISDHNLPDCHRWQATLSELRSGVVLPFDFIPDRHHGYLPVMFRGRKSGFEYFYENIAGMEGMHPRVGNRERQVTFTLHGGEFDLAAANWTAAALAQCADGVFFDPQSGAIYNAEAAIIAVRHGFPLDSGHSDSWGDLGELESAGLDAGPRNQRKRDSFDEALDAAVSPLLLEQGFSETKPYVFTRHDAGGHDIVCFNIYDETFVVTIGYVPSYMREINEFFDPTPTGTAPGSLRPLAPTVVVHGRGKKIYPCSSAEKTVQSMQLVYRGWCGPAQNWLRSLRDPSMYAAELHAIHPISIARALEEAGRFKEARAAYNQQLIRSAEFLKAFPGLPEDRGDHFVALSFIYSSLKIQADSDLCRRLVAATGFRPSVEPLPE